MLQLQAKVNCSRSYAPGRFVPGRLAGWLLVLGIWFGLAGAYGQSTVGVLSGPITNPANQHQYYLLEPGCWADAEAAAVALGGHLVSIDDEAENSWVSSTFGSFDGIERDLWIGLLDPNPAVNATEVTEHLDEFGWISGHPVTVRIWASPYPFETNATAWGYCKLCRPDDPQFGRAGRWADESPATALSGVVELPSALEIVAQPKNISVGIGCDATFSILAEGTSPLAYQWQASGRDLPGETRATLTIPNAQPSQSGAFSVVVRNASGTLLSATAYLAVGGIVTWGSTSFIDTRTNVPPGLASVVAIAAGRSHDLALKPDGTVVAWGEGLYHQLDVPADLTNVVALAGALYHSLALKADGTVVVWGYARWTGAWVPDDLTNVVAIAAHGYNNLALKADGTVVAWGGGDGARPAAPAPAGLSNVVAISLCGGENLALKADGRVVAWGCVTGEWELVPDSVTNVVAISSGELTHSALKSDGTVVAWAANSLDLLAVPAGLSNVVAVAAGPFHTLALKADGSVIAWGNNYFGETTVPLNLPNVVAIAAGGSHSIALLRDGAPSLTVQPHDQSARQGSSPSFVAKAVGMQSMRYQWRFNGADIAGATRDTYSFADAQPANAGLYSVAISNPIGTLTSRHAKLVVSAVNPAPANFYEVNAGARLAFTNFPTVNDPARRFTFSLVTAPKDARLASDTGIFSWRPPMAAAGTTNAIEIRIADDSTPPVNETRTLTVIVNPLAPVQLASRLLANGRVALQVSGMVGPDYIVETSADLIQWTSLQTSCPAALPFDFADSDTNSFSRRFYRVRLGP